MKNKWSYLVMIAGVLLAVSQYFANPKYAQFFWIGAMVLIMIGIYSISRGLSSKRSEDFTPPTVMTEKENKKEDEK